MATKRPDQLPSGTNFEMNDLLMIEKDPDTFDRSLVKTSISDFMGSALKFDPERFGQNPITGFQSQFQWLMTSMNTLSNVGLLSDAIDPYSSVQQQDPNEAQYLPTPTPSITPSNVPIITPSATPPITPSITPSSTPASFIQTKQFTFSGTNDNNLIAREIPTEDMPEYIGNYRFGGGVKQATGWEFASNMGYYFQNDPNDPSEYDNSPFLDQDEPPFPVYNAFPDNFTKSVLDERLYRFEKAEYGADNSNLVAVSVVTFQQSEYSSLQTPLLDGSSITFTIRYLY